VITARAERSTGPMTRTPIRSDLRLGVLRKFKVDDVVHRHHVRDRDEARDIGRGEVHQPRLQPQQSQRHPRLLGKIEVVAAAELGQRQIGRHLRQPRAQGAHVGEHPGRRVRRFAHVQRDVGSHARRSAFLCTTTR
jgi:hypothetical protein